MIMFKEEYAKLVENLPEITTEPDSAAFIRCGYLCQILRTPSGHLCGYVTIPESHPIAGVTSMLDDNLLELDVHGGITYIGKDFIDTDMTVIGFDCAHYGDRNIHLRSGMYKDFKYVQKELERLAKQLKDMEIKG